MVRIRITDLHRFKRLQSTRPGMDMVLNKIQDAAHLLWEAEQCESVSKNFPFGDRELYERIKQARIQAHDAQVRATELWSKTLRERPQDTNAH